ncbi:hypothetical protein V6N11_050409 [Hibiscus sabdariffa]|uniref:Uncharacterized protein n=1 Tax=Hibiscus sabdariffa TaxID=183260 RepID=A0ABR2TA62_9ROSI
MERFEDQNLNLTRSAFDDDVTVLADGAGLLRKSFRSSGIGFGLEMVILIGHDDQAYTNSQVLEIGTKPKLGSEKGE